MYEKLITDYSYLVDLAVNRIDQHSLPAVMDRDDLYQIGCIELIRCHNQYKQGAAKFSTYATACIRGVILKSILRSGMVDKKNNSICTNDFKDNSFENKNYWLDLLGVSNDTIPPKEFITEIDKALNRKPLSTNKNGMIGVYFCSKTKKLGKWRIYIEIRGARHFSDGYHSSEEAYQARKDILLNIRERCV